MRARLALHASGIATEHRDLLPQPAEPLPRNRSMPVTFVNLRSRDHMSWADWRQAFLDQHEQLMFACTPPAPSSTATTAGPSA
jgi:hypothetical protein